MFRNLLERCPGGWAPSGPPWVSYRTRAPGGGESHAKGHIKQLPSGSFRVSVYAGAAEFGSAATVSASCSLKILACPLALLWAPGRAWKSFCRQHVSKGDDGLYHLTEICGQILARGAEICPVGRVGLLAEASEVINRGGERRERGATECGGGEQGLTGDAMVDRPVARQGVDVGVVADSRVGRAEADGRGDFSASTVSMG